MNIQYQQQLRDNPSLGGHSNRPMTITEIEQLETLYNTGDEFPKSLRELLFLAGNKCAILDGGISATKQMMQDEVRASLSLYGKTISRPFYVIDVYNANDQFLFVYLDEGDDPDVYEAMYHEDLYPENAVAWIHKVMSPLSAIVNSRIQSIKKGNNPF